jgi:hypothetical protein
MTPGGSATIDVLAPGQAVPEPCGLTLAGVCLGALAGRAWRKRRGAG